jgi:hypothetical protein
MTQQLVKEALDNMDAHGMTSGQWMDMYGDLVRELLTASLQFFEDPDHWVWNDAYPNNKILVSKKEE